jgi:aconitate hydratase
MYGEMPMNKDDFHALDTLHTASGEYSIYRLDRLEAAGIGKISRLPFSIRILLEGVLRNYLSGKEAGRQDVINLAAWKPVEERKVMPFFPGRVIMQDFTGVPVVNDLAAMRSAMQRLGGDPGRVNPVVPVDLVIDHSVQVDYYARLDAFQRNAELEFKRNRERYELLHWAQKSFQNLTVVPPATGIVHQVNLEHISKVVLTREENGKTVAYPDTLVGTDSHTTMINGLGVVGWGVGGIEATAAMLGQPIDMLIPNVIGFKLYGKLQEGVTPTDLTLTIVQMLRKKGVVEKFVEFYGPGLAHLPVVDRAMISNMSPENGATITYFPVDEMSLIYLQRTGRPPELIELVEAYCKQQHIFRETSTPDPQYTDTLELDLASVEPSVSGPRRPQDRMALREAKRTFEQALTKPKAEGGFGLQPAEVTRTAPLPNGGSGNSLSQGAVVIAAITSCTNTSNPTVMIGAGLLAKKAVEKGLAVKPYVKTSLAPGSRVVSDYLKAAGLMEPLEQLGFGLVGYGCTTCIGNSGPLPEPVAKAISDNKMVAVSVLSGNRNFEGRIHPLAAGNYLASPPLVVAYALAGTVDIDLTSEPLGTGKDGKPVFLRDIWPTSEEIAELVNTRIHPEMFRHEYANVLTGNDTWNQIQNDGSQIYRWDLNSTYLQEPPFFQGLTREKPSIQDIRGARALVVLGDSITTDHISPAGAIPANGPAGLYLQSLGVKPNEFNSFGSRRGNDRVMTRGTFGNIRIKNLLLPGVEGYYTLHLPDNHQMPIYDAAMKYKEEGVPLIVLAGKEYGSGSSRDWAAKGTLLLGVRAVIAESYERIHRSNLVGMGVLPLQYRPGENAATLGLTGRETFTIENIAANLKPGGELTVHAIREDGSRLSFNAIARIDIAVEMEYYRDGGIMNTALYRMLDVN